MQKTLFIASLLIFTAFSLTTNYEEMTSLWSAWKTKYDKSYLSTGEEAARFAIFMDNYKEILKFNSENHTSTIGLNKFADITSEEFKAQMNSRHTFIEDDEDIIRANTIEFDENVLRYLPNSIDWREKGAVTRVKDQGDLNSSYAFSATGAIEGAYAIENGKLLTFSEQQIVDCFTDESIISNARAYDTMNYAAEYGLELEADYPYVGVQETCKYDKTKAYLATGGGAWLAQKSAKLLRYFTDISPISVLFDASSDTFFRYTGGVITTNCPFDSPNHYALVVGYTIIDGIEAFIVKNSWGTGWGDGGYVYISTEGAVNVGYGVCGILYTPIIAHGVNDLASIRI